MAQLRPLSVEDGQNGYWDAKHMGNGQGHSFVVQNGVQRFVTDEEMARIVAGQDAGLGQSANAAPPVPTAAPAPVAQTQGQQVTLNIGGKRVKVGAEFLRMSPEQQNATVEEIAGQIGATGQQPGNVANPSPAFQNALAAGSQASQRLAPKQMQPDLMGSTAAALSGMVNNGLPVIGPLTQKTTDALLAGGGMLADQFAGNQGPDFGGRMQAIEDRRTQIDQANPIANFGGGLATGLGSVGAAAKIPAAAEALGLTGGLGQRVVNSGLSTLGIGTADNIARGQAPAEALTNAAAPSAVAAVLPGAGALIRGGAKRIADVATRGAQRTLTNAAIAGAPAATDLKAAARAMFKDVDSSGIGVKTDFFAQRIHQLAQKADSELIDAELDAPAVRLYNILADRTRQAYEGGRGLSLGELHNMRQIAQDIVIKSKGDRTGRFADQVVTAIDDIVGNLKPSQMEIPPNLLSNGPNAAGNSLLKGISTWGRAKRVDLIEEALFKAQNQASGVENGLRTQFRALLQNKSTRSLFSPAEIEAIQQVANGTSLSNVSRLLGTFGFDLGSGRNAVGGALGLFLGGPVGAIVGTGARKLSENLAVKAGERAAKVVATPNIPTAIPRVPSPRLLKGADAVERLGKGALLGL